MSSFESVEDIVRMVTYVTFSEFRYLYKNIYSSITYYILAITLDVSSIDTHISLRPINLF
jgi:hypothetical protein